MLFIFHVCHPHVFITYIFPVCLQVSPALSERLRVFETLREKQGNKKRLEATEKKPLSIRLADGRTVKGTAGVTTPVSVAQSIR